MRHPTTALLLVVLLLTAACPLAFRFFTTIDGPVHVLTAYLSACAKADPHQVKGFAYAAPEQLLLGHWILRGLLALAAPERAHDLFAVLVGCSVVLALFAFLRAQGVRPGPAILWAAPLLFSDLLIMGLFHFMLAVAVAFLVVAWWKRNASSLMRSWGGLLIGLLLAAITHRSGPLLVGVLFTPTFLFARFRESAERPTPRSIAWAAALAGSIVVAGALWASSIGTDGLTSGSVTAPGDFLLQPLYLFDRAQEAGWIHAIGAVLLIALIAAGTARWRLGRRILWHDALLLLAMLFLGLAFLGGSSKGKDLLITDRAQWMALLLAVLWSTALAESATARTRTVIAATALLALPLHALRVHRAEAHLAPLRTGHDALLAGGAALAPGGLVLAAWTGGDRLLQHHTAYLAMRYPGIIIAPGDRMTLALPNPWSAGSAFRRFARDPYWILRHWRKGLPAEVDQVYFAGRNVERTVASHPWPTLLNGRFARSFASEHVWIYARGSGEEETSGPRPPDRDP